MSENRFKHSVAAHLKTIRSQRKLSLDDVAKLTGVSKAMLGQIEREESSPTIAKLWQIATGLETSFSAFLSQSTDPEESPSFPNDPDMKMVSIFPYSEAVNFEIHEITLTTSSLPDVRSSCPWRGGECDCCEGNAGDLCRWLLADGRRRRNLPLLRRSAPWLSCSESNGRLPEYCQLLIAPYPMMLEDAVGSLNLCCCRRGKGMEVILHAKGRCIWPFQAHDRATARSGCPADAPA